MTEYKNGKKPIDLFTSFDFGDPIEHYLNVDDDEESPYGAALFRETLGFSIDDLFDSDNSIDDEEIKTTRGDNND